MPRGLRNEVPEVKPVGRPPKFKYAPFTSKEELPLPTLDTKGKVLKYGEARYVLQGNKLIAIHRKPSGLTRKLCAVLLPNKKTTRGYADKKFLEQLKQAGVQQTWETT